MAAAKNSHQDYPFHDVILPRSSNAESHQMDTRVGRLEGVVEALSHDIAEVSKNVGALSKDMNGFRDILSNALTGIRDSFNGQLNSVIDRITVSTKPQWQTIAAFASIAIALLGMTGAVVGLIMSGHADNINSLKGENSSIMEKMFQQQYDRGRNETYILSFKFQLNEVNKKLDEFNEDQKKLKDWQLLHTDISARAMAKQDILDSKLDKLDDRQYNLILNKDKTK